VEEGAGQAGRRGVDRLTIRQAARRLGVSEGAVRKRLARGTLRSDKEPDGRVYVYLDGGIDEGVDEGVDDRPTLESDALISQLRDEIAYLREESRRKDEIIVQQAVTMRQLTAGPAQGLPRDEPRAPQGAAGEADRGETRPADGGAQEGSKRRPPWWRKLRRRLFAG
jgi:AcrR family transcriptional regulator